MSESGIKRVVIEQVEPQIDCGRYPVKRVANEPLTVRADVFGDGRDAVRAVLRLRRVSQADWLEYPMRFLGNDRWEGVCVADEPGDYVYVIAGWVDHFATWRSDLLKKRSAHQDLSVEFLIGAGLLRSAARHAVPVAAEVMLAMADVLESQEGDDRKVQIVESDELERLTGRYSDPDAVTVCEHEYPLTVERRKALFSTWYELFPRSFGTFADVAGLLPDIALSGFDVLYFPPIHPIGRTNRKGKNNLLVAQEQDPGSPWAIGSTDGGHLSIDPALGSLDDFRTLVADAGRLGIDIALDLAFQCSPDHPWVSEHPEWFRQRPDGTIQHAENPPKKYEDIVPFDFETPQWMALWEELRRVVVFWISAGVRIFRVDNPHTKPLPFWEWLIREIRRDYPDVLFLAEAFTRPKVMYRLAKLGFSQSYTYFTWRNTKQEFIAYIRELTFPPVREYFRPNFWPNTPDILPEYLQYGGRPAFINRLVLAATLSSNYGVYGPAYEQCVAEAVPGREEYIDSEKYEIRRWVRNQPGDLGPIVTRINAVRRDNPALQATCNVVFCDIDNDYLIGYVKTTPDRSNCILVIVNLDPFHFQSGWVTLPLGTLGIDPTHSYMAYDLLGDEKYIWSGVKNYVILDPHEMPAHIFRIQRRIRRENDFDYFM